MAEAIGHRSHSCLIRRCADRQSTCLICSPPVPDYTARQIFDRNGVTRGYAQLRLKMGKSRLEFYDTLTILRSERQKKTKGGTVALGKQTERII
ncbi:hypothetical protein AA0313_0607 [Acetobacter indonesiensis NRIC 0313]|uniref:Uncharacterized protein n=1 Tax=Acetobacter indonesiensis TaxID=104101 RepID=A0A6N3T479_9PROT|nr:hypothetical protein Abin_015_064 [Acetobacter indonesiensis]GBQ54599.1 hypothetical protein AA0313_0607 [Acetobacter indonesiensis NRIC 0313]GEN02347.1 hypothetical protein AIN02nite_03720 [Acetobacter indonesiensis]